MDKKSDSGGGGGGFIDDTKIKESTAALNSSKMRSKISIWI